MPQQVLDYIAVDTRTIRIADEVIALPQVVSLRVTRYRDNPGFSPTRRLLINLAFVVAFIGWVLDGMWNFVSALGGAPSVPKIGTPMTVLGILTGLGLIAYCLAGPFRWILVTELASGRSHVVSAPDPEPLYHLQSQLWQIIEDPPHELTNFAVHNVYTIDLKNSVGVQVGGHNVQTNS